MLRLRCPMFCYAALFLCCAQQIFAFAVPNFPKPCPCLRLSVLSFSTMFFCQSSHCPAMPLPSDAVLFRGFAILGFAYIAVALPLHTLLYRCNSTRTIAIPLRCNALRSRCRAVLCRACAFHSRAIPPLRRTLIHNGLLCLCPAKKSYVLPLRIRALRYFALLCLCEPKLNYALAVLCMATPRHSFALHHSIMPLLCITPLGFALPLL